MKVVIVGAGASGLMAALRSAEKGYETIVIEHEKKAGKKLLATGNGRCNLTNESLRENPWEKYIFDNKQKDVVETIFKAFGYEETVSLFKKLGIVLKSRNGLMYPNSDQASAVLETLLLRLKELEVKVMTDTKVIGITKENDDFRVKTNQGDILATRVIVAAGSKAQPGLGSDGSGYEILKNLGHLVNRITPGLVQLRCSDDYFKRISGVRTPARISLSIDSNTYEESGELQLTDYGISGIAVMNLSNYINEDYDKVSISIDLLEEYSKSELENLLNERVKLYPSRYSEVLLMGILPQKLGMLMMDISGIGTHRRYEDIDDNDIAKLSSLLKNWSVTYQKKNTFDQAQICMGGVPLSEIKPTMESRIVSGLYITGELIDVHGPCGGYNLQWAWTSGWVAAENL